MLFLITLCVIAITSRNQYEPGKLPMGKLPVGTLATGHPYEARVLQFGYQLAKLSRHPETVAGMPV